MKRLLTAVLGLALVAAPGAAFARGGHGGGGFHGGGFHGGAGFHAGPAVGFHGGPGFHGVVGRPGFGGPGVRLGVPVARVEPRLLGLPGRRAGLDRRRVALPALRGRPLGSAPLGLERLHLGLADRLLGAAGLLRKISETCGQAAGPGRSSVELFLLKHARRSNVRESSGWEPAVEGRPKKHAEHERQPAGSRTFRGVALASRDATFVRAAGAAAASAADSGAARPAVPLPPAPPVPG